MLQRSSPAATGRPWLYSNIIIYNNNNNNNNGSKRKLFSASRGIKKKKNPKSMGKSRLFVCVYIFLGLPPALPGFCQVRIALATFRYCSWTSWTSSSRCCPKINKNTKKSSRLLEAFVLSAGLYYSPQTTVYWTKSRRKICAAQSNKGCRGRPLMGGRRLFGVRQWSRAIATR